MSFKKDILIEIFLEKSETEIYRVLIHSNFGHNFNTLFSLLLSDKIFQSTKHSFKMQCSDSGISFLTEKNYIENIIKVFNNNNLFENIIDEIPYFEAEIVKSLFFNRYFKRCAYRFLSILKNNIRTTIPEYILINMLRKNNLICKEAVREIMYDFLNFPLFLDTVNRIKSNNFKIVIADFPSPLSYDVLNNLSELSQKISPDFLNNINHNISQINKKELFELNLETGDKLILFSCGVILIVDDKNYLIVGDLHLGLEYSLMKKYRFTDINSNNHYNSLWNIFNQFKIYKTILLGDIKESITGYSKSELNDVKNFFDFILKFSDQIIVTQGNHDSILSSGFDSKTEEIIIEGKFNSDLPIVFTYEYVLKEYSFLHGHRKSKISIPKKYLFSCHVHPRVDLKDSKGVTQTYLATLLMKKEDYYSFVIPSVSEFKAGVAIEKVYECSDLSDNDLYFIFSKEKNSWFSGSLIEYISSFKD